MAVYGQSYTKLSSGMFTVMPCFHQNITEYEYYGVTFDSTTPYSAQLLFVGCENGTVVKVGPEVISLNEMETYIPI